MIKVECTFEVNGEKQVEGYVYFEQRADRSVIIVESIVEFSEPLVLQLERDQHEGIGEFLNNSEILFWKVEVPEHNNNLGTMLIVDFAREPDLVFHLSIYAGINSRHFETSLSSVIPELKVFFSESPTR